MRKAHKPRRLLASDLDGTLIPVGGDLACAAARFRERLEAMPQVAIAYVTGRHLALALDGIRAARLPDPAFIVGDVGTSIHLREDGTWRLDESYRGRMIEALGGVRRADLLERLEGAGLSLQAPERQAEFKLSYTFEASRSGSEVDAEVDVRLAGLAVRAVISREAGTGIGLLDVLPAGVAKDTAVRHLRDRLGLTDDDVLFAGDSGNDRDALLGGWNAVLVENAPDALRAEIRAEAERVGGADRVHLARAEVSDGVLEALDRLGW